MNTENGYAVLNYNYGYPDLDPFYSFSLTDYNGEILERIDTFKIEGVTIESIESIQVSQNGFLFFANVKLATSSDAFISVFFDFDVEYNEIIDTLHLITDEDLNMLMKFKQNVSTGFLEGFGTTKDELSNEIKNNFYLSVNVDGFFSEHKILAFLDFPTYILDFQWMHNRSQYFVTMWNRSSVILDEDLLPISSAENTFVYEIGDTTFNTIYTFYDCFYVNEELFCSGTGGPANNYNFSIAEIVFEDETFSIKNLTPLLPDNTTDDIVTSLMVEDSFGNFFAIGAGFFIPFNNAAEQNNLYITKLDGLFEVEWQVTYSNEGEIAPIDLVADVNGDLVNIGAYKDRVNPNPTQGYFFKIFRDGSLVGSTRLDNSTFNRFNIAPNPVLNELYLFGDDMTDISIRIFSSDGRCLLNYQQMVSGEHIDVSVLGPGLYYLEINTPQLNSIEFISFVKH